MTGGIDDVWQSASGRTKGELLVVDYKATAKNGEVNIDAAWQDAYKRQIEIYQWLFRRNDFPVSNTGYFVYVNGKADAEAFDGKLEFDVKIIPYEGNDSWIENSLLEARRVLELETLPPASPDCDFCRYRKAAQQALAPLLKK